MSGVPQWHPVKFQERENMKTLLYFTKVIVFALTIGTVIIIGANLYGKSSSAYASTFGNSFSNVGVSKVDEYWLAINMYYEAATEPRVGKIAVGIVTLNRVRDPRYPKTVKDVVTEDKQFSWYNTKIVKTPSNNEMWEECKEIARMLLTKGATSDMMLMLEGATHYHTTKVNPSWAKTKTKIVQIGEHIFYRYEKI